MEQNNKLTAVDWMFNELKKYPLYEVGVTTPVSIWSEAKKIERKLMIDFYLWMKQNDTYEYAEKYFHYTNDEMVEEFLKQNNNQ